MGKGGGNLADPATSRSRLRWLQHGDAAFHQGDDASDVCVVVSGVVVVTALSPAGREAVLGLLGPGQVFGQSSLAAGRQRATARALGRSVIRVVDVASVVLVNAAGVVPVGSSGRDGAGRGIAVQLAGALAARCDVLEEWLADLGPPGRACPAGQAAV